MSKHISVEWLEENEPMFDSDADNVVNVSDESIEKIADAVVRKLADRKTEPLKTADYCDICKQDMCKDCIADSTNPYCVPSHYEIKQTENSSEIPTGSTISKMEQVGKDINVRSKDEEQTDKDKVVCPNCGRSDYIRSFEKDFGIKNSGYKYKCINCNTYIKDTPQTEDYDFRDEQEYNDRWQTDCGWK